MTLKRKLLLSVALLTGTSSWGCRASELCDAIRSFANAKSDEAKRSVELSTRWDGVPFSPSCKSDSTNEGSALCAYLRAHPSSEYPQDNLAKVLACLSDEPVPAPRNMLVDLRHAIYTAVSSPGIHDGISVTVELDRDRSDCTLLRITAENLSD